MTDLERLGCVAVDVRVSALLLGRLDLLLPSRQEVVLSFGNVFRARRRQILLQFGLRAVSSVRER